MVRTELNIELENVPLLSGEMIYAGEGDEYPLKITLRLMPAENQRIIHAPKHLPLKIAVTTSGGVIDEYKDILVKHGDKYVCDYVLKIRHSWFINNTIINIAFIYDGSDPILIEEYSFKKLIAELWRRVKTRKYTTLKPTSTIIRLIDKRIRQASRNSPLAEKQFSTPIPPRGMGAPSSSQRRRRNSVNTAVNGAGGWGRRR